MDTITYRRQVAASRNLAFPSGEPYLRSVIERFAAWPGLSDSVAGKVLKDVDFCTGAYYLTVPFDCPEDFEIKRLEDSYFLIGSDTTEVEIPEDYVTLQATDSSIYESLKAGTHTLLFDRPDPAPFPRPIGQSEASYLGCTRPMFWGDCDDSVLVAACHNSLDEIRYLVRGVPAPEGNLGDLLGKHCEHLVSIACSVLDWSAYLLWFSAGDRASRRASPMTD